MKFLLLSHHNGIELPPKKQQENLKAWENWVNLLKAEAVLPVEVGRTISANTSSVYTGDIGGALIFEANNIDEAVKKAQMSPGLQYGWTHDILQEMSLPI